jgi:hypothetical protein
MIYTFGDSHAREGFKNIKKIQTIHLGPKLCYSVGRDGINVDFLKDGDTIIFCVGEIDCRCHIHKHVTPENTFQQIIDNIVEEYIKQIKKITKKVKICIYNIIPPVEKVKEENDEFPIVGPIEDRIKYAKYFNKKLEEYCLKNRFIFIDIYNSYANKDGSLNMDLSDGIIHIRNSIYLEKKLYTLNILKLLF